MFEPPTKGGCRDSFLIVFAVLAVCVFVAAVIYLVATLSKGLA